MIAIIILVGSMFFLFGFWCGVVWLGGREHAQAQNWNVDSEDDWYGRSLKNEMRKM